MPRPSTAAVAAAVRQCQDLGTTTQQSSAIEALLATWRLRRLQKPKSIKATDEVVADMFGLRGDDSEAGRVYAFKRRGTPGGSLVQAGRNTVWNTTTRGETLARDLFEPFDRPLKKGRHPDFRGGARPDAAGLLGQALVDDDRGTDRRPKWRALAAILLRDVDLANEAATRTALLDYLGHSDTNPLAEADLNAFTTDGALGVDLLASSAAEEFDPGALPSDVLPPASAATAAPTHTSEAVGAVSYDIVGDVVVDPRIERMLETAVRTYRAVLLVGPPGSGKNTLLKRLIARAQDDPDLLGLSGPPEMPLTRTPDESWTSFELIGGQAPVQGGLRYTSGAVLDAIRADRWLLLDETNRADMDKIFGALLTWLSMDAVELGTLTPESDTRITLGWNLTEARSTITPEDGLAVDDDEAVEEVAYRAGKDWRLLGTYNPQDAQRVFRFGVALSRRFAIVPVPPLQPSQFEDLLSRLDDAQGEVMPPAVRQRIANLYRAHFATDATQLGPAVFLRMVEYVMSALPRLGTPAADQVNVAEESAETTNGGLATGVPAEDLEADAELVKDPGQGVSEPPAALLDELLAEAYLVRVGKYLSTYDSQTFDELGQAVINGTSPALSASQWDWVAEHRGFLG